MPETYVLARDPKDSKYINLALASGAPYLVTTDNDLLELMDAADTVGADFRKQFPNLQILDPRAFQAVVPRTP